MIINKDTKIIGTNVVLVPYREEHVVKYHSWMQSEELQRLTGSSPLTLDEEYEMQKSWLRDPDKCTFIVLDKNKYLRSNNEVEAMIGDTNLYFAAEGGAVAEAEIMIAEPWARGKKCGRTAMSLMLLYGIAQLQVKEYMVKILFDNVISIAMFKNLGFVETGRSDVFQEITLNKFVDDTWIQWLKNQAGHYELITNDDYN